MFTKTLLAITAALVVATSMVSTANAQRGQPFAQAEQNWFDNATGRDDGMPSHR